LRIALASVFIFHGWLKLAALGGFSQMLGLPISVVLLVALAEFVGGILILAGAFTRDWVTLLLISLYFVLKGNRA
jgi:putative oxidoreductase